MLSNSVSNPAVNSNLAVSTVKRYRIKCEACHKRTVCLVGTENGQLVRNCESCGADYTGVLSSVRDCPHDPICGYDERAKCHKMRAEAIREKAARGKRVREVVSTEEVPHLWAHKAQREARNAQRNLFFRDETIYSYGSHFPIASHVTNKRGQSAVVFTTGKYSNTTAGHCSAVRSAIPPDVLVFHIPNLEVAHAFERGKDRYKAEHAVNLKHYETEINFSLLTSARARSDYNRDSNHGRAVSLRKEAIAYAKFFGLRAPTIAPIPALSSNALAAIKKREAQRVAKEARETARKNKAAIAAWLAGDSYARVPANLPALLRIVGDEVETSQGAKFPISHAKRGLALVRAVMSRGEEWRTNGHTCHLGHYSLDRITPDGTVYAGCHVVPFASIERIAPQIDAYVVPASQTSAE